MSAMQTISVYSEAGGVAKTTTAVSIAMTAAQGIAATAEHEGLEPRRVVLIDLDPRHATTKWSRVKPAEEWQHVGAIIGNASDATGTAADIALPSHWHPNLRIVPADRSLSLLEAGAPEYAEFQLQKSLIDLDADLVVIDCANRQGGILTRSAFLASDSVLYAATASDSGVDGVEGAQRSVRRFNEAFQGVTELGVAMSRAGTGFMSLAETDSIDQVRALAPVVGPIVPYLSIVPESRSAGEWYGNFRKGQPVAAAYGEIMREVVR
jgi:cellulose biosynthesis protein BcsQ